jgi:hypothetical protein
LNNTLCSLLQKKVIEIRAQLVRVMKRFGIPLKSCEGDMKVGIFFPEHTSQCMLFCIRRSTPIRRKQFTGQTEKKNNETTETKS